MTENVEENCLVSIASPLNGAVIKGRWFFPVSGKEILDSKWFVRHICCLPGCAKNLSQHYCLDDYEYPVYEIQHAVEYHYAAVAALYKDVLASTENSVDRLVDLADEQTYLCGSYTSYVHPKRAINSVGQWRIVVNDVQAHYETLTQTARVEACAHAGQPCPLVPECYHTKCVQKFIYHRFLVYDPYDYYFPFAIESFLMPSSCACYNGAYAEPYHKV